jgi:hypothetical protein
MTKAWTYYVPVQLLGRVVVIIFVARPVAHVGQETPEDLNAGYECSSSHRGN